MALQPRPFVRWTRAATVKRPIVGDLNRGWTVDWVHSSEVMWEMSWCQVWAVSNCILRSTDLYSVGYLYIYIYICIHTHCTVLTTVNWWNNKTCLNLYTLPCQQPSRYSFTFHGPSILRGKLSQKELERCTKGEDPCKACWYWRGPHTPMTSVRMTSDQESFYVVTWVFQKFPFRAMQCRCCVIGDRFCICWILNIIITSVKRHQSFISNFFRTLTPISC